MNLETASYKKAESKEILIWQTQCYSAVCLEPREAVDRGDLQESCVTVIFVVAVVVTVPCPHPGDPRPC